MGHHLPAYFSGLPHETALRRELAPPPDPAVQWVPAAVLAGLAAILLATGAIAWGVVALLAAGGAGFLAYRRYGAAVRKLASWHGSLYCKPCHKVFLRRDVTEAA
ncbi:hypothetical protein [Streptomyces sp. DW26H14]|uniref:hypothetical protein n=1 Tax=Streptomyces sp. DW26H14 TaxID=3435395 RepID=UPI00403E1A50